jgi:predicted permease
LLDLFVRQFELAVPLFILVALGYGLVKVAGWGKSVSEGMNTFVFNLAMPALLFHLMSDLSKLPPVDTRLLLAFFGGCLLTFLMGYGLGGSLFKLDGTGKSILGLGGIFSNNVLIGIPLAKATLGNASIPSVALILVFNSLTLWSLLSISIEWSKHGSMSVAGFRTTLIAVAKNPIIIGIITGASFGLTGWSLPSLLEHTLVQVAEPSAALSLIVLGMGLAEYNVKAGWRQGLLIVALKLTIQPFVVWGLATLLGLPMMETKVVVLLASLPVGVNVYLMARQYQRLEGTVAASLVLTTVLSAITTPTILVLLAHVFSSGS